MSADDRTADMALLPAEREMSPEAWAEYGGLPAGLRSYCFRLMRQEADARVHLREAELEVAEWRDRTSRLLSRAEAAEQRAEALATELAQARAEGEAAGAARERAAVVAYLREPAWAADVAGDIERGEHVGAAGGAR